MPNSLHGRSDEWYRTLYTAAEGPSRYENAPIAMQIVGRRLEDEKVLQMTRRISQALTAANAALAAAQASATVEQQYVHPKHATTHDSTVRIQSTL